MRVFNNYCQCYYRAYNNSDNHNMIYQIVLASFDIFKVFPNNFISDRLIYNMYCAFMYLYTSYNLQHASHVILQVSKQFTIKARVVPVVADILIFLKIGKYLLLIIGHIFPIPPP